MTNKDLQEIENLKKKRAELDALIVKKQNQLKAQEKKRKDAMLYLRGSVAEAALNDGSLKPEQWQKLCQQFLPEGKNRELALEGIGQVQVVATTSENGGAKSVTTPDQGGENSSQ